MMSSPLAWSRRRLLGLAVPTLALVAGCAVGVDPTDPTDPTDLTPLPDPTGTVARAVDAPPLLMYGDGQVIRSGERQVGSAPSPYLLHQVDAPAVARFVTQAMATGVIGRDVDFGEPGVTDLGSTSVVLDGPGGRHSASAYALDEQFDEMVDAAQRDRRRLLRRVIRSGYDLIGATGSQAYVPDRAGVLQLRNQPDAGPATVPWPGPDPAHFLHTGGPGATHCGELTGTPCRHNLSRGDGQPGSAVAHRRRDRHPGR